eukprot:TRINITY_DN16776_c0_g2_i1.p1 TRINITY_DN16776_c0_g2~~TRINITY_DN16776_c0_g2_i1.p1  ORF type:complete len:1147 (-),score=165.31 TRINITY_DN16776_c0_g2_i1:82-3063(-)
MMATYNRIIGGVRLKQERGKWAPCKHSSNIATAFGLRCFEGETRYQQEPEYLPFTSAHPTNTKWVWLNEPMDKINRKLLEWETSGWIDELTSRVEIAIPLYNLQYHIHTFLRVNFFFSRGGRIWKKIDPVSLYADWFMLPSSTAFDVVFSATMLYLLLWELRKVKVAIAKSGIAGIWRTYLTPFTAIEWFAICTSCVVMVMIIILIPQTDKLNRAAIAVGRLKKTPLTVDDQNSVAHYVEVLQSTARYLTWCEWMLAIYPLLAIIRLMKAFHAQSGLSHVTKTLIAAVYELAPFLLMFVFALGSFALSGCMLFGRQVAEFSSLPRSMTMCFLILSGNFEFATMAEAGYVTASLWIVSFVTFVGLVLFNIFLGIILEAYYGVKANLGEGTTLVQEIWSMGRTFCSRRRDRKVSLSRILRALKTFRKEDVFDDDGCADTKDFRRSTLMEKDTPEVIKKQWVTQPLFVENLIQEVNKLPHGFRQRKTLLNEKQATEVLVSSVTKYYWSNWNSPCLTDSFISAEKLQHDTRRIERLNTPVKQNENATASERLGHLGQDGTTSETFGNDAERMSDLSGEIKGFVVEVQADRQERACEVARLRAEVGMLRSLLDEQRIGTGQSGPPELGLSSEVDPSATLDGMMFTSESLCSQRPLNKVEEVDEHLHASKDVAYNSDASTSQPHITPPRSSNDRAAVVKHAAGSSAALPAASANPTDLPVNMLGVQPSQAAAIARGEPFPRRVEPVALPESSVSQEPPEAPTEAAAVASSAALATTPPLQPGAILQGPLRPQVPPLALGTYTVLLQNHGFLPANYKHGESEGEGEDDGPVSIATCSSESSEGRRILTDDHAESEDDVYREGGPLGASQSSKASLLGNVRATSSESSEGRRILTDDHAESEDDVYREGGPLGASQSSKASLLGNVRATSSDYALSDGSHGDDMNPHRNVVPTWREEQLAFRERRTQPPVEAFRRDASFSTFSEAQHRVRQVVSKPELLRV